MRQRPQWSTTGGASAWQDLALYLIGRFCGAQEAVRVARLFLLGDRGSGNCPLPPWLDHASMDAVIARIQAWLVDNYTTPPNPVSAMVERPGLSVRSFKRRFLAATAYTPVEYVRALRVEEAKQMLESEDTTIEEFRRQWVTKTRPFPQALQAPCRCHSGTLPPAQRDPRSARVMAVLPPNWPVRHCARSKEMVTVAMYRRDAPRLR